MIRLKIRELPKELASDKSEWYYWQHGGKDPRIRLMLVGGAYQKLSAVVRPNDVYIAYSATVPASAITELAQNVRHAQAILKGTTICEQTGEEKSSCNCFECAKKGYVASYDAD